MADEIPTEALEAAREAVGRLRNPELQGIGPNRDIVVMPDEYAECVALADAAVRAAAPYLIAEGRRQVAREIATELRQSATIMAPSAAAWYHAIADDLDAGRLTPSQAWQQLDETPVLMARYEREQLRAKIAAELRAGGDELVRKARSYRPWSETGDKYSVQGLVLREWAARIAEGTDHG